METDWVNKRYHSATYRSQVEREVHSYISLHTGVALNYIMDIPLMDVLVLDIHDILGQLEGLEDVPLSTMGALGASLIRRWWEEYAGDQNGEPVLESIEQD